MPYGPTKFVNGQNQGAAPVNTQVHRQRHPGDLPGRIRVGKAGVPDAARLTRPARRTAPRDAVRVASAMLSSVILVPAVLNGLMTGAVYALDRARADADLRRPAHHQFRPRRAADRRDVRGVLCASSCLGLDPYVAALGLTPLFFLLGYGLQRFVIGPAAHGEDRNILLVTLGLAVVIENALLYAFRADTRTINLPYAFDVVEVGTAFLAVPRVIAFVVVVAVALALWLIMRWTDTGKAIRAVAKEKLGAELAGIDVAHIYAVTFGLGTACLAIAACLLIPTYYVNPQRRQRLRADRLHHRRARRHGLGAGRADRRPVRRRGGEPVRPLSR